MTAKQMSKKTRVEGNSFSRAAKAVSQNGL
jgi:hypothetical protein